MGWSIRQVADLAGTTAGNVRQYHRSGLLPQPDRTAEGYKLYQISHLVRVLQIQRLLNLGVPLDEIEQGDFRGDASLDALQAIDADIILSVERVERLKRTRAQIEGRLQA